MNFSSDSVKHESKSQNEDFYFDLETSRGHFFAVIDFDAHDFANLNATLKGKLETIVSSFVSLSRFSADLFLGFLAKEINNFLHNLREQAGGPQLVGNPAFLLLTGNRLTYLVGGNLGITIYNGGKVKTLQRGQSDATGQLEPFGRRVHETPPTEAVQTATLDDDDVVLLMTEGLSAFADAKTLTNQLEGVGPTDAPAIRDAVMQASPAGKADRTVLVIAGPYDTYVDPVLSDLSRAVAALESRVDSLAQSERPAAVVATPVNDDTVRRLEDRLLPQIELLKEDLRAKAGSIDLLELDEKVKGFAALVGAKADKSDVLSLQSELLKLSVATDEARAVAQSAIEQDRSQPPPLIQTTDPVSEERPSSSQRSLLFKVAGIVLVIGFASAFAGAWLQSRLARRSAVAEAPATASPSPTLLATAQPSPSPIQTPAAGPTEIAVKPGDSLKKLAQQYNVPQQTIMELNPSIKRWNLVQPGQKILVPPAPVAAASPTVQTASNSPAGTIEVVVGPGDSINRFAQRYGTTPDKIRELNPQVTNWASIQTGQKLLMPAPPSG